MSKRQTESPWEFVLCDECNEYQPRHALIYRRFKNTSERRVMLPLDRGKWDPSDAISLQTWFLVICVRCERELEENEKLQPEKA